MVTMRLEINQLAEHYARTSFQVELVYRGIREPGMETKAYTEPFAGFIFPIAGKAEYTFNGIPYILYPGKVVHGGARMELTGKVLGNTRWEYLLVLYKISGIEPEGICLPASHFELATGVNPRMSELVERLWKISSHPGGIVAFQKETLFRTILEEVFISVRNHSNRGVRELFEQISEYIHVHYMEPLTVSGLAEQNGINKNRLAYIFYKYANMGPGDYLLQYRLNRARELLLSGNAPVKEIAAAVGFNDPFYFSRAFKKHVQAAPSEYRELFINNT